MDEDVSEARDVLTDAGETPPGRCGKGPCVEVRVFHNWCKGCGLCIAFCPQNVFDESDNGHPVVSRMEDCTACLWCYLHCPDFAITVRRPDADGVRT